MMDRFNVNNTLSNSRRSTIDDQSELYSDIYNAHYIYLLNLITSRFVWRGLPKIPGTNTTIRSSYFERMLVLNGMACVCNTEDYGLIVSPCYYSKSNVYGKPLDLTLSPNPQYGAFFYNGDNMDVFNKVIPDPNKYVIVYNDNFGMSDGYRIQSTARMLTECYMAMVSNANQQHFPLVVYGNSESKLTAQIIDGQIKGHKQILWIKDDCGIDLKNAQVLNVNVPYVADKLHDTYLSILSDYLTQIGINAPGAVKKERLIVDEVDSNNQAISAINGMYYNQRSECVKDVVDTFVELPDFAVERNTDLAAFVRFGGGDRDPDIKEVQTDE